MSWRAREGGRGVAFKKVSLKGNVFVLCVQPQDTKKRKQLAKAWEVEFARKCQPLEPKLVGCLWLHSPPPSTAEAPAQKVLTRDESFLMQFAVVPLVSLPLVPTASKGETSAEKQDHQGECTGRVMWHFI